MPGRLLLKKKIKNDPENTDNRRYYGVGIALKRAEK
jgi:hypothetical protein